MKRSIQLFFIYSLILYFSEENFFTNKSYAKNKNEISIFIDQIHNNIENILGSILLGTSENYIKYINQYKAKICINFFSELVTIETVHKNNYNDHHIYNGIITNVLSKKTEDSYLKNKFLADKMNLSVSSENLYKNYTNKFTRKLLHSKVKIKKTRSKKKNWFVTIQIDPIDKKARQYLNIVYQAAKKYGIDPALILAIIQIESGFNPDAVSRSDALGLMQIVQHTAGRDVFKMKGKIGNPSRNYLLNPCNNIDIGTAYLSILQNSYLNGIINPISKRYAVISAYHSGAGSVLKVFSKNQNNAIKIINKMKPNEVYHTLYTKHPSIESRKYLQRVNILQKSYML